MWWWGRGDFTTTSSGTTQNTFKAPRGIFSDGKRLFICDTSNHRVLIYNIGGSSVELGPQFEQGKAVLGKVFNDINANGWQDEGELGIEGVKVASDTGIYAITDEDGKYHFPYIETGQRLLKIDVATLPEGSSFTTDNPYKITVTEGSLSKVSFGVKLPSNQKPVTSPRADPPMAEVTRTKVLYSRSLFLRTLPCLNQDLLYQPHKRKKTSSSKLTVTTSSLLKGPSSSSTTKTINSSRP